MTASTPLAWRWCRLQALDPLQVLAILRARQEVFVVEQQCIYPDIDELDPAAWHLLGTSGSGVLDAYLRAVPPSLRYREPAIGRVLVRAPSRGHGLGRRLMEEGIRRSSAQYPGQGIRISAQARLRAFYTSLGFTPVGAPYLEDGIPHLEMLRRP